jgi:hypothetical protein
LSTFTARTPLIWKVPLGFTATTRALISLWKRFSRLASPRFCELPLLRLPTRAVIAVGALVPPLLTLTSTPRSRVRRCTAWSSLMADVMV